MRTTKFQIHSSILAVAASLLASAAAGAQAQAQPAPAPAQPAPKAPSDAAKPAADKPGEIVVTGTRADVTASPDRMSFNVANDLQAQTGTVADALRAVPGVEVDLQGRVSLRGDPGVEIWIDGRPSALLRGENRGDVLMSMPAGQIQRVEVITNPSAAFSPEGSGGIINLVSKQARKDATYGTVRATVGTPGAASLSLNGTHSAGPLTLTGDAGYRRMTGEAEANQLRSRLDPATGNFLTSRQDSDLDTTNAFRNTRLSAEYDLNKENRLSSEFSYGQGTSEVERSDEFVSQNAASSYGRDSDIALSQRGLNGRASWRRTLPGKEHEFVADLTHARVKLRREVEAATTFAAATQPAYEQIRNAIDRTDSGVKLDYKKPMGEEESLNVGYQGSFVETGFDSLGARGTSVDALLPVPGLTNAFEYDQTVHALYGTYRFALGKLNTQAGLRLEQVDIGIDQITDAVSFENDYFRAYPTLNFGYELADNQQLRGSYSRRVQRPSPQDLNPYTVYIDPQNLRRGNPFLRPEVTDSFELGWNRRQAGTFYSLTSFYRVSRGGVTDILSDIGAGVFLTTRANLATAKRVGLEALANGKLSKALSYNVSGTFLWNEIDPRIFGISEPRSGTTGNIRANIDWQPTPKDFLQLNAFYSGKQLLPQGYRLSSGVLNLGYRRKVNDRLSLLLTAQNVLDSAKFVTVFDTPTIKDRFEQTGLGRSFLFGLTYNLGDQGSRKRPEPAFDFQQGGVETPQ
jgi:outer membrane receptor protein involved in Fe transport